MFVTSDVFDLARIGRFRKFDWRENLICGVAAHGTETLGYQAAAKWLLAAVTLSGLESDLAYAGYDRPGERRTRSIAVSSFERLAKGKLRGAREADGLLLRGERDAEGCQRGSLLVGGETSDRARKHYGRKGSEPTASYPDRPFDAGFCFPLNDHPRETMMELLRLSVALMDAEYGHSFVMDDLCGPTGFVWGLPTPLDWQPSSHAETKEVGEWRRFVAEGRLWTAEWPLLRDIFEVNLISERHTSVPIDRLGYLSDWIRATSGRGVLEDLGRGRLLWTLTSAEMLEIRPVLNQAGLLFSCRPRVYRDLTPNFKEGWERPT